MLSRNDGHLILEFFNIETAFFHRLTLMIIIIRLLVTADAYFEQFKRTGKELLRLEAK